MLVICFVLCTGTPLETSKRRLMYPILYIQSVNWVLQAILMGTKLPYTSLTDQADVRHAVVNYSWHTLYGHLDACSEVKRLLR